LVADAPILQLEPALERFQEQADLVVVSADRISATLFLRGGYLRLPSVVDARMAVPTGIKALSKLSQGVASDLRRLRRSRYTWKVTTGAADFSLFYERFYLPFVRQRHGELAVAQDCDWLRYHYLRSTVLWIMHDREPVAGTLLNRHGTVLTSVLNGVLDGDVEHLQRGALAALYVQAVEYAHEQGCRYFDFGGSRPSLHDGVLRYKRKWGITLRDRRDTHDILIRWYRWTPAVAAFLTGTSLIYRLNSGLSAVAALNCREPAAQEDADHAHHLLWTGGLHSLSLINSGGWREGIAPPTHTRLLGPSAAADLLCP